jgi:hypothetical protein
MTGTIGLFLYSDAKTVAAAKATVVCPEGKELYTFLPLASFAVLEKGPRNLGSASTPGS